MDIYYVATRWADLTGGTFNDGMLFIAIGIFCVLFLFGWAVGFTFDLGLSLYDLMKRLFQAVRRYFQRKKKEP